MAMLLSSTTQLIEALNLGELSSEEETSAAITALLVSATHDIPPRLPLSALFHELSQAGASSILDPLAVLPLLLPHKDQSANDILALMGECSPAKEVVMAVQEAMEHLESLCDADENDHLDEKMVSPSGQLIRLVELYASCIPRLKLRRKSPSETLNPLCSELESVIRLCGPRFSRDEGRALIVAVSHLVNKAVVWLKASANDDSSACDVILKSLLDCTIVSCERCIQSSLAQRSFEHFFPRLTVRSAISPDWEGGSEAVQDAITAYNSIGISKSLAISTPSTSTMIVFAHSALDSKLMGPQLLLKMIPILIASIQTNSALDEALAILLHALDPFQTAPRPLLPDEVIYPIFTVLPPLCSSHPDPLIRHQAYRILSLVLSSCPQMLHLQLLKELSTDSDFPQMCVAAIGLIKEAVLEAIAHSPSIFASPQLLKVLGTIIFRTNPPDLFTSPDFSLDAFKDTTEPARLVECLGLYYTILQRDRLNLTRIRDPGMLRHIENTFLYPMRTTLKKWTTTSEDHTHALLPLISLQICLERIDEAKSELLTPRGTGD